MSINRQEFTTVGRDMLGRANNGEVLTITTVVVGEDRVTAPADLWPLTEIPGYVMDVVITQQIDQGDGVLLIDASFNSSQAPRAFELAGVGVMAHIAAEPDRLYSVANVLATGFDHVDPDVESIHAFKIKVVIDRATNVTVVIGTSQDIMGENIGAATVGAGVFSDKLANTLRFKRLVMGPNIEIDEDADTITIGLRTLEVDLDIYVPTTYAGMPAGAVTFDTIAEALDYLSNIQIPPERTATIHVDSGDFPESINITHPNSQQIIITGTLGPPITMSQAVINTNAPFAHLVEITVNDNSSLSVNDYVMITGVQGLPPALLNGFFQVVFVGGAGTLVRITLPYSQPVLNNFGAITGTMRRVGTLIRPPAGAVGIRIRGDGLGLLNDLGFVATPGSTVVLGAVDINNNRIARLDNVSVYGFSESTPLNTAAFYATAGGRLNLTNCYAIQCAIGAVSVDIGSLIIATSCSFSYNIAANVKCSAGQINLESVYILNASAAPPDGNGIVIGTGGLGVFVNVFVRFNMTHGVWLSARTYAVVIGILDISASSLAAPGSYDILLTTASILEVINGSISISAQPTGTNVPRTVGAVGSMAVYSENIVIEDLTSGERDQFRSIRIAEGMTLMSQDGSMITPAIGGALEEEQEPEQPIETEKPGQQLK
jgi:hypothetical protein